jgi:hypothetical protein
LSSASTTTAESAGYNTPTETVSNSIGLTIVRVYGYRFGLNRRQGMRGNVRQRLTLPENL